MKHRDSPNTPAEADGCDCTGDDEGELHPATVEIHRSRLPGPKLLALPAEAERITMSRCTSLEFCPKTRPTLEGVLRRC